MTFGIRGEVLHRNAADLRPASRAPALGPAAPRPSQGPVMGNIPIGLMQQQAQVASKPHRAVHLQHAPAPAPAPVPVVGRALPQVVARMPNPPVPVVGRGLPAVAVVPTAPVYNTVPVYPAPVAVAAVPVRPAHQPQFVAHSPRRHIHWVPTTWTPVASFAVAVLGIGVFAAILAPEAALIIFPAALLLAISSVAIKAIFGK